MPSAKEKVRLARPRARVAPDATRRDAFDAFVCTPRAFEYILKSPRPTPPSTQTCTICFVDGAVCDGILCAETHYTCGECFEAYVMSESGKSLGELKKREGRILCPFNTDAMKGADRCNATCFADKDIAKNVSNDAFAAYLRAREKIREEAMARPRAIPPSSKNARRLSLSFSRPSSLSSSDPRRINPSAPSP